MKYTECFNYIASRRTDQIVITSAGNSGQAWWAASNRDSERTFYLDASMSLSTMFGSGMAMALPQLKFWVFMGDGAFCMNPGMLMVERDLNLPNMVHLLVSNRVYGATSNADLPNKKENDYGAIGRAMGLERVYTFASIEALKSGFDEALLGNAPGHTFVVLEVEPFDDKEQKLEQPPIDAPELKYRFGRTIERLGGIDIFGYKL